ASGTASKSERLNALLESQRIARFPSLDLVRLNATVTPLLALSLSSLTLSLESYCSFCFHPRRRRLPFTRSPGKAGPLHASQTRLARYFERLKSFLSLMSRLTSKPEVLGYAILISKQSAQLIALNSWPSSQCRKL
ncbi:hypothetical protein AMTR_s00008p00159810, partial [Amborella trichopoda]